MARPARSLVKATLPTAPAAPWQRDATVRRLTRELLAIDKRTGQAVVSAYVDIGRRLIAVHERLDHGQWSAWVAAELPWSTSSANRFVALARWAEAHPAELRKLQHLGLSKVLALIAVDPSIRAKIPLRAAIAIPGAGVEKPLAAMSVADLGSVIGGLTTRPPDSQPPIGSVVKSLRYRVGAVDAWVDTLIERADEVDPDEVSDVRDELRAILEHLDATFG